MAMNGLKKIILAIKLDRLILKPKKVEKNRESEKNRAKLKGSLVAVQLHQVLLQSELKKTLKSHTQTLAIRI